MTARVGALALLVWALGFVWFALLLPQPLDGRTTDAIVVLTGGSGRLSRGITLLEEGGAKRMLISGVDRAVKPHELAVRYDAPDRLFDCCITLGHEAIDTRSNAIETAQWLERRGYDTVRLITSDWHMRRAAFELRQALPPDVVLVYDAVPTRPAFQTLFREYHKYVLRRIAALIGV
ncbi:MAG TPA: YdcF family protein [Sphingobium sp.]|nr:YdcF family protein [Sphingobium sp.]